MARPDPTLIDRRDYLRLSAGVAVGASAGLAGCSSSVPGTGSGDDGSGNGGDGPSATGLLSTAVSDQPGDIGDFESCIVTIDGIWVGPRVGDSEGSGTGDGENETDAESGDGDDAEDDGGSPDDAGTGRSSSDDDASGSQDDTSSTGNTTDEEDADPETTDEDGDEGDADDGDADDGDAEADEGESDEEDGESEDDGSGRTYYEFDEPQEADLTELQGDAQQLVGQHELSVGTYQFLQLDIGGIRGTLTDESEADVETPGNAPLKFNEPFDVREGYRTTFLADFTPVERGNGSYLFQPVASETEVNYEEIESGTGDGSADGDGGNSTGDDGGNATSDDGGNTTDGDGGSGSDGDGNTIDGGNQTAA